MPKWGILVAKLSLSLGLAFGAFILLTLALVSASLFAPFNLFAASALGLVGSLLVVGIIRTWRSPVGWRFALIVAAVSFSLWAYLEYGAPYVSPPIGTRLVAAP
jgi:cytochrome bd-type quinol oxidase subunit 2